MNDLVAYISMFDPTYPSRIEGATAEELNQLERLAGRALPSDYRAFASLLGHNDGGLRIGGDSSTDVRELIAYYSDLHAEGSLDEMIPDDGIVIAYSGVGTPELCLDTSLPQGRVIYSQGRARLGSCAESLSKLAFRAAFSNFRRKRSVVSFIYEAASDAVSMDLVSSAARQLGFTAEWFSDGICQCQSRGETLLLFQRIMGRPVWLRMSSRDERELERLGRALQQQLGLTLLQRRNEDLQSTRFE